MKGIRVVLVVGLLLSGCTSTITGSPTPAPAAARSALAAALSRVPAAALGDDGYFEFGDSARLRQLASADAQLWRFQGHAGAGPLSNYAAFTVEAIGVDLSTAASVLTVGQPPRSLIVITGGQDRSRITTAATKSGWTGAGVLSRDLDLSKGSNAVVGISLAAPKIRPIGSDVVLSQPDGDPVTVAEAAATAASPADRVPALAATINCLGDVPSAQGFGLASADPSDWTATGAGAGTATTASSVICLGAADPAAAGTLADKVRAALATGKSKRSLQPWKTLLQSAKVDVVPGTPAMVRITANTATAVLTVQMLATRDIQGR